MLKAWIAAAVSFLAAVFMFWRSAKQSGRKDGDIAVRQMEAVKEHHKKVENAQQIQQDSSRSGDADIVDKLRNKWSRD